jgi:hypothetical protein
MRVIAIALLLLSGTLLSLTASPGTASLARAPLGLDARADASPLLQQSGRRQNRERKDKKQKKATKDKKAKHGKRADRKGKTGKRAGRQRDRGASGSRARAVGIEQGDVVLLAAGDIGSCNSRGDEETANLLDRLDGTIATLGDHAYESGSRADFQRCYAPTWGRHLGRTRPSPGNHDYNTNRAAGYFDFFGPAAGESRTGYYSYDLGSWHIIALNSNCDETGGCGASSRQVRWLRDDLQASAARCTLAYWHHPLFTSGNKHGGDPDIRPFWDALYEHGADIVLSAHEHSYERFAPQDPSGSRDQRRGIRQFIVGTGGAELSGFGKPEPNSEARIAGANGVLMLRLDNGSYSWRFVAAGPDRGNDGGSGDCH